MSFYNTTNPPLFNVNRGNISPWQDLLLSAINCVPPGSIIQYAGISSPTGYLLCDGSAISREVYAGLFIAIDTIYGAGDGSTTFNLPNFTGRIPVCIDNSQIEFNTLGQVGGEKTHTLTTGEMPSHNHSVTDSGHAHTQTTINDDFNNTSGNYGGNYAKPSYPPSDGAGSITWTNTINSSTTGISINNSGGGLAHNNLQPYIVTNYIIKY
jgi:microcystin-dependent protein